MPFLAPSSERKVKQGVEAFRAKGGVLRVEKAPHCLHPIRGIDHSGQLIATSHDLTPNGVLVREISYFREIWVGELL